MKTYNVCWSGGLDSTFIVTQLSAFPVRIRPFYIKGQTFRLSEPQELAAIAAITELLKKDPRTKAEIMPIEIIEKNDPRLKDRDIVQAYRRIYIKQLEEYKERRGGKLPPAGSQQIYADGAYVPPQNISCASLAKSLNEAIEVGTISDDFEHLAPYMYFITDVVKDNDTGRSLLRLNREKNNPDWVLLFQDIRFPVSGQKMYKRDVWNWYNENDYENVRLKTITCQSPMVYADGSYEPCGTCNSCIGIIREGVTEPFTEEGLARYRDYEENHEKEPERFRLKGF